MKEFIHTVTGCSHIVLDVWTYLILLLRFACKFKSWVLDQMLISGRIYLIRVFHKTSIGYHLCMDPCADHVIVEDGIVKKLGCGNWYWVLYWSWLMKKLYEILYITNYDLIDFFYLYFHMLEFYFDNLSLYLLFVHELRWSYYVHNQI